MVARPVPDGLWNQSQFTSLPNEGKQVFLYFMTSPHIDALGCQRIGDIPLADVLYGGDVDSPEDVVRYLPAVRSARDCLNREKIAPWCKQTGWTWLKSFGPSISMSKHDRNSCINRIPKSAWFFDELAETSAKRISRHPEVIRRDSKHLVRRFPKNWRKLRVQVYHRDGGMCVYCDKKLSINGFTVDHIVPAVLGGSDDMSNLSLSCRSCNCSKKDKLLGDEWLPS